MNKFEAMHKVNLSDLKPEDKCLLNDLILLANEDWQCWPSVERLCKVRGIKHEKNFKGADHYLPGIVTKTKRGRKNTYTINTPALEGLLEASVNIKHTPAVEGVSDSAGTNTPAVEGVNTPAVADNTPAVEGANSTKNNTIDNTTSPVSDEPVDTFLNSMVRGSEEVLEEYEDVEVIWEIEENEGTSLNSEDESTSLNYEEQDPAQPVEKENSMNIIEWNKKNFPSRSHDWDSVEKFYNDAEYLPNQQDPSLRLQAAIKRVAEMEWASW